MGVGGEWLKQCMMLSLHPLDDALLSPLLNPLEGPTM
jgi:hypothetical protein